MSLEALRLEPFTRPQAHLGSESGVDAEVAVDFICKDDKSPLHLAVALNAGSDDALDIIGILLEGKVETFQNARHLSRALITK